jgi:hypothetical protein
MNQTDSCVSLLYSHLPFRTIRRPLVPDIPDKHMDALGPKDSYFHFGTSHFSTMISDWNLQIS